VTARARTAGIGARVGTADVALALVLLALVAACGSPAPTTSPSADSAPAAATSASPSTASSPRAPSPPAGSSTPTGSGLTLDPTLVDLLPAALAGLDRQTDPDVDAHAFADPALRSIGTAGASAIYIDAASGEFAYATLIRLLDGRISDAAFRAYRDSFDAGACSQAGGPSGNAEATIAGHRTFIGSCAGGLHTYHAVLPNAGLLLSISSAGDGTLAPQLLAAVHG
jgi:hypothetical protein